MKSRRRLLIGAASSLALPFLPAFAQGDAKRTRLVLLGTKGGPRVSPAQLPKDDTGVRL